MDRVPATPSGISAPTGVLDEPGRPRSPADAAAHLHVLDRVRDAAELDVVEVPHGLGHQVVRDRDEPLAPAVRHRRHGPPPEVPQAFFGGVRGHRRLGVADRHEELEVVRVCLRALEVAAVLEVLEEMVVEEEHPHVPVGDEVERVAVAVRVRVRAHERVVHLRERRLVPHDAPPGCGESTIPILLAQAVLCSRVRSRFGLRRAGWGR
jgi:hypothetical protein